MFGNLEGNQDWGGKQGLNPDTGRSGPRPDESSLSLRSSLPGGPCRGYGRTAAAPVFVFGDGDDDDDFF